MDTHTPTTDHQQAQTPAASHNGQSASTRHYVHPRASVFDNQDGFTVEVEMPGVNQSGLEITFDNGELTLVGHRAAATPAGQTETVYRESHGHDYRRVFEVDATIDASRIAARLDQGLLTLTLPKAESAKPRRIEINGAN
jgi:HSP20 family protein